MYLLDAVTILLPVLEMILDPKFLSDFRNTDKNELDFHHFGLGLWIRNNLLAENSVLYESLVENNFDSKDDISAYIIKSFHDYLAER